MMRWADRFENVQVVHHQNGRGWEPLEPYHLGFDVKQHEVEELLNLIYAQPRDLQALRDAYRFKVPDRKLVPLDSEVSVGLKMRWKPPRVLHVGNDVVDLPVNWIFKRQRYRAYREYMVEMLHENGVVPMLYESFLDEPQDFWSGFLGALGHDASKEEIRNVLSQDMGLKKVHSGHISEYVENHQELEEAYESSFKSWTV